MRSRRGLLRATAASFVFDGPAFARAEEFPLFFFVKLSSRSSCLPFESESVMGVSTAGYRIPGKILHTKKRTSTEKPQSIGKERDHEAHEGHEGFQKIISTSPLLECMQS